MRTEMVRERLLARRHEILKIMEQLKINGKYLTELGEERIEELLGKFSFSIKGLYRVYK